MTEVETPEAPIAEPTVVMPETILTLVPGGKPDLDAPARQVATAAAHANQPVRMRMTVALFLPKSRGEYRYWPGVSWKMEFRCLEDILQFREDLAAFVAGWFAARKGE